MGDVNTTRRANKAQVAKFFDVSVNTVDSWIRRGCPVLQMGTNGRQYALDLLAVAEWYFTKDGDEPAVDPDSMTPQDRKAWFESEKTRRYIEEKARTLIPAAEVEEVIVTCFAILSQGVRAIPDTIERRLGCSPEMAAEIQELLESAMDAAADSVSKVGAVLIDE